METGSQKSNKAKNKTKQKKRIHEDQKRYKYNTKLQNGLLKYKRIKKK